MNFKQLYGEYDFVFFGDDGQGDLFAGQLMLSEEAESSGSSDDELRSDEGGVPTLRAVLIHEVLPKGEPLQYHPPASDGDDNWRTPDVSTSGSAPTRWARYQY